MTNRKNLKITEDTYELLRKKKRDMETWDSFLRRVSGADTPMVGDRRQLVQSTVRRYVKDKEILQSDATTTKNRVYNDFLDWKRENDVPTNIPRNEFGRAIQNLDFADIDGVQRRVDGNRVQMYTNVAVE